VHDLEQEVIAHRLEISPAAQRHDFDDVFGNRANRLEIQSDYTEFRILSRSVVRHIGRPPVTSTLQERRLTIPLVWMPWQREMMHPFLLPPELPESQLRELSDFAMSFVERQDYDLVEALIDLNQTIFRDFQYVPGVTSLATTPFAVYTERRGVCQDFANLFICLARLLNVPARYRVGYIYTGGDYANKMQSDASHAWVEVYLPWDGWRGFDPTNGIQTTRDHVRVACGRNYRDATPTSGTIFSGGGTEVLATAVRVQECWANTQIEDLPPFIIDTSAMTVPKSTP
jgi:transglutaminase-like putative cysteine protease